MKKSILVVAPHPDDETYGCGGTLLRHIDCGDMVHWLIVTDMRTEHGFSRTQFEQRQIEIRKVATMFGLTKIHNLGLPPAKIDTLPKYDLVAKIGKIVNCVSPEIIYLPFRGDVHTDHAIVFDAVVSCTKWFRYPYIRRVLCYETLSETDFDLNPQMAKFTPNCFVDISLHIDRKIEIAQTYQEEMGQFPFPRSAEALRALAQVRGAACGSKAAESFIILREINK